MTVPMTWKNAPPKAAEALGAPAVPSRANRIIPGSEYWRQRPPAVARECGEVLVCVAAIAVAGWFVPVSHHVFGYVYLLTVIALSLRVGRWPVLVAAVVSALAWSFVFIPPRLSFAVLDLDDALMLGMYFFAALIGGQLAARIRAQERLERQREQRATAFLYLTRALAGARGLDDGAAVALRQADDLFNARTALLLTDEQGALAAHPAGSFQLDAAEHHVALSAWQSGRPAGRGSGSPEGSGLHLPLLRAGHTLGVFSVRLPAEIGQLTSTQWDLIEGFSAQIALLVERERLRAASEREKLLAESDRLHRTLLDSVSHELKTPLAVLRSAGEKLGTGDALRRGDLVAEIRTATQRLDRLVANLLHQTRLEAGALRPQLDWCEAGEIVAVARRAVGDALAAHTVAVAIAPDMPLFMADAILMEQTLANLLLNAALHTPPGSTVQVIAGLETGGARVFVAVKDNGPGIDPALLAGLFQKFTRGPAARAGGLGLGLSIVRGFMQAQGGEVTAALNPAGGMCFTLYLPHAAHGAVPDDEC